MCKNKVAVKDMKISDDFSNRSFGRRTEIAKLALEGFQTFYTPFWLADSMIPKDVSGTIRIFFNIEFLEVLKDRKYDMTKVQYIGGSARKCRYARLVYPGVEAVLITAEDWDLILSKKKSIQEFFVNCKMNQAADVTFSNPPYKNIDLKIIIALREVNLIKKLIVVHPSAWLVEMKTRLNIGGLKINSKIRSIMKDHITKIEFFNPNPVFGIGLGTDCVITETDFSKKRISSIKVKFLEDTFFSEIQDIDDITLHGKNWAPMVKEFKDKIKLFVDKKSSFDNHRISSKNVKNEINAQISIIRTNKREEPNSNFYTFELLKHTEKQDNYDRTYLFSSEQEKTNFINAIKLDFIRLCLSLIKTNSIIIRGELALVPWLDFTQSWDDDKLFSFFGYPKGHPIREYAKSFLPDYHNLYQNGKTY